MNQLLDYKDDLLLIETEQNGYGDNSLGHLENVKGLFLEGTSQNEMNYTEMLGTDAHVYLDIENPYIKENAFRLEGMYLVANIYNGDDDESWYKISRCKVGQRKLLDNDINNVHCFLTKCEALDILES